MPLPMGTANGVGEICLAGPNIMQGYLNNPEATARTVIDGWLHTGDIGYQDERGNFFIVDRKKELIKVKGLQVAPAELEGLLLQHPGIADAAVVSRPDERNGEAVVAFVVRHTAAHGTEGATEDDIKAFIASRVADYKRISEVRFINAIPKSAAGKILRRILRDQVSVSEKKQ